MNVNWNIRRFLFNHKNVMTVILPMSCVLFCTVYVFILSIVNTEPASSFSQTTAHFIPNSPVRSKRRSGIGTSYYKRKLWNISSKQQRKGAISLEDNSSLPSNNASWNIDGIQYCNPKAIHHKVSLPKNQKIACQPHIASKAACVLAEELYQPNENYTRCKDQREVQICQHYKTTSVSDSLNYRCTLSDCQKYKRENVLLWYFSKETGKLEKQGVHRSKNSLEKAISKLARTSSTDGYNFLFLECWNHAIGYTTSNNSDVLAQFLILPPSLKSKQSKIPNEQQKINVNIMLLDSTARSHFYRSLPKTIRSFNEINRDLNSQAEILDFQLFQSVEGHTMENLHALFTGNLFPKHFTGEDREDSPVGVKKFFETFLRNGYETIYQDDLCYEESWGVRMEFGSPSTFQEFKKLFKENHITYSGLTFSSCKVLSFNNVTDPFNGPDDTPVCFNGQVVAKYYLDFIHLYHETASNHSERLVSFTTLNVAHDATGQRIQSIDHELAEFVKKISKSENTLTLLLADHGNTYTDFTHAVMEGRFEQYHPSFFMIIPDGVKKILGNDIMNNLRLNQLKLFTMLDIRRALIEIPNHPRTSGIFGEIAANRTCNDLELRLPNLCVCEGWDMETLNNTAQVSVLDFAVGQLNNKIQDYQKNVRHSKQVPFCMKLVPLYFSNVRERNEGEYLLTSLDFVTAPGRGADQSYEVFHVEVRSEIKNAGKSLNMTLLNFDRISKYGPYRSCGDKNIDMRLCVCDIEHSKEKITIERYVLRELMHHPTHTEYDLKVMKETKTSPCIFLRMLSYPETTSSDDSIFSASFEVSNMCSSDLNVSLYLELDNMKYSTLQPLNCILSPYSTRYMGSVIRTVPYWDSDIESMDISIKF